MALPLSDMPSEILREVRARKWLALMLFVVVSFGVLAAGFFWPYKYQSETVIFIDDRNIIRPLMEGSAVATEVNKRASSAKELLWSRSVMEKLARDPNVFGPNAPNISTERLGARIGYLRTNMMVTTRGENYFAIGFRSESPRRAFQVAQKMGQLFISESNEQKKSESRNAYEFINNQVKSYENQLAEVEVRLKEFLSVNVDGTENEANSRRADLRKSLELAELERSELQTRARSLETELSRVNPTIAQGRTVDAYQTRISSLEEQLDNLRLRYHDTYPDIVSLRQQIQELRRQRERALANQDNEPQPLSSDNISNPVYQEIQAELSRTRANMETVETRINSFNRLLAEQSTRMERIQENKAQYSELTRDMEVNKQIYDDLLKRRERARVSMSLDIEGQGLNYRINENAQYPLSASGPKFGTFAAAGLFLGILAPFGLVAGLLQIDPRIRVREQLEDELDFPVLVALPSIKTPFEQRRAKKVTFVVGVCAILAVIVYLLLVTAALMGVIG
ncbi:XrtA system polysaccharide chain length determinant [Marinobacter sp.]|uniref:XrtA system polysaccharide chain length determinant n=1 Tax=Marinobacter sp. TaxID=50741 RepID=UPI0034A1F44C